jgi:hypothetical protein
MQIHHHLERGFSGTGMTAARICGHLIKVGAGAEPGRLAAGDDESLDRGIAARSFSATCESSAMAAMESTLTGRSGMSQVNVTMPSAS